MDEVVKKKKPWLIPVIIGAIAGAFLIFVLVFSIVLFLHALSPEQRLKKQLKAGEKYMTELDYEQAVLAFRSAITIDPNSVDAFAGYTSAVMCLADQYLLEGNQEAAVSVLKEAILEIDEFYQRYKRQELGEMENLLKDRLAQIGKANVLAEAGSETVEEEPEDFTSVDVNALPEGLNAFLENMFWIGMYDCEDEAKLKDQITWVFGNPYTLVDFGLYSDHAFFPPYDQVKDNPSYYRPDQGENAWAGTYIYDADGVDWILKNIYHVDDSMLAAIKNPGYYETIENPYEGGFYKQLLYYDGKYEVHSQEGWGGPGVYIEVMSAEKAGDLYHVCYKEIPAYDNYTEDEIVYLYAIMEYKVIDGKGYWSIYEKSTEPLF